MASDSTLSPPSSEDESSADQKPNNSDANTNSIDTSLDAIESQLSSIAFNSPNDERTPPNTDYNHESGSLIENEIKNRRNSIGESGSGLWRNDLEIEVEPEVDGGGLSSPTSSGYAGERGSSGNGSVSSGSGGDVIREVRDNGYSIGGGGDDDGGVLLESSESELIRGKRHDDEVIVLCM